MSAKLDGARAPRAGEELDHAKLSAWLSTAIPQAGALVEVQQFPRGYSNLTYLVRCANLELVLRRPPVGNQVKSGHDMSREVRILSALQALPPPGFPLGPRILAQCEDASVLGAPFYAMQRLHGVILRGPDLAKMLPEGLTAEQKRALDLGLVDLLAHLHALDVTRPPLLAVGKPEGYVQRQVSGWTERYAKAKTDDIPEIDEIATWLAAHLPRASGAALLHNDYKFDNVVLDPDSLGPANSAAEPSSPRILGVLDWEMATLGDPLMDLGTALAYWLEEGDRDEVKSFAFGPTFAPGSLTRREVAERYAARTGRDISGLHFHVAFALFKNAVVAQQIYARWKAGLTKDERFGALIFGVKLLGEQAVAVATSGKY